MNQAPATRPSLILRLRKADDLCAWQEFVEIYQPVIRAFAIGRGLQPADADDVTQEVLTRVARSIDRWDPDPQRGSFRAWLATITRNLVIQFFREKTRQANVKELDSAVVEGLENRPAHGLHAEQFDMERERQLFLWAARKVQPRFEPRTWQAFWRTAVLRQDVQQVAAALECTRAQVYVSRSRVMSLLRKTVQQTDFDAISEEGLS